MFLVLVVAAVILSPLSSTFAHLFNFLSFTHNNCFCCCCIIQVLIFSQMVKMIDLIEEFCEFRNYSWYATHAHAHTR